MNIDKQILRTIERDPLAYAKGLKKTALKNFLNALDDAYHDDGESPVSDEAYDIMAENYTARFGMTGSGAEPKIGAPVKGGGKVVLPVPMGSLNKLKPGVTQLPIFLSAGGPYVVSDKEDGISLEIVYDSGIPQRAFTRGDGKIGKDVSGVLPALRIPQRISEKGEFIIRGEFTADKAVFQKHYAEEFATSRNHGGGLLNRNQPSEHVTRYKFVVYEVMKGKNAGVKKSAQLTFLKTLGFTVVPWKSYPTLSEEKLVQLHNLRKGGKAKRDIDGIVVERDIPYKVVQSGNPTHAYAFKINSLESSLLVKVKDVVWEESRLGRLIPRVQIEPTLIGGVMVEWFTGHNNFFIEHGYKNEFKGKKKPPYEPRPINKGAMIRVIRSGDVIPYIMAVEKAAKTPSKPSVPYRVDGVHLMHVTVGIKTNLRVVKELTHFFTVIEVDGLKQGTVQKLVDAGIDTVKKILNVKVARLLELEGFQRTSATALVANLAKAKANMTFGNVAKGSGAFGDKIGATRLAAVEESIPDILDRVNLPERELEIMIRGIRGFKELAAQIAQNLPNFVKFLKRNGIELVETKKEAVVGAAMKGQAVLFTSVRDAALQKWIVQQGGKIASTVNQATMLIIKEEGVSNNKTVIADTKKIPILTLEKFKRKYKVQ
jgi:NAD-dependent DNA ligase